MKKIIICFVLIFCVALTSCGKEKSTDRGNETKLADAISEIKGLEEYSVPEEGLAAQYFKGITYEVKEIEWDGDKGTATVQISVPDTEAILNSAVDEIINSVNEENYDTKLNSLKKTVGEAFTSSEAPVITTEIQLEAEKKGESYVLISSQEFIEIIDGNAEELFFQYLLESVKDS